MTNTVATKKVSKRSYGVALIIGASYVVHSLYGSLDEAKAASRGLGGKVGRVPFVSAREVEAGEALPYSTDGCRWWRAEVSYRA